MEIRRKRSLTKRCITVPAWATPPWTMASTSGLSQSQGLNSIYDNYQPSCRPSQHACLSSSIRSRLNASKLPFETYCRKNFFGEYHTQLASSVIGLCQCPVVNLAKTLQASFQLRVELVANLILYWRELSQAIKKSLVPTFFFFCGKTWPRPLRPKEIDHWMHNQIFYTRYVNIILELIKIANDIPQH
jgi:hypothetical protein